jgi:type VI secretion system protein ImpF
MDRSIRVGAEISIIDRLLNQGSSPDNQFLTGLRRDLEDLLNTLVRARTCPNYLDELNNSMVNYGITDLMTANFTTKAEREKTFANIRDAILLFEPRLVNLSIVDNSDQQAPSHTLMLKIIAETIFEDSHEEIIFNSKIDTATGAVVLDVMQR